MSNEFGIQEARALLKQAGSTIRNLVEENKGLRTKVATSQKKDRIAKIAMEMEDKGLNQELSFEEKIAALEEARNLEVTEEAIKMAAPQKFGLGGPSDHPGMGESAFEAFILTGEDLNS